MKKHILCAMLSLSLFSLSACSLFGTGANNDSAEEYTRNAAVTEYNADSLRNYKAARNFAAQGRYELAREHYLLALASANEQSLQNALAQELESIDMIIRSLR